MIIWRRQRRNDQDQADHDQHTCEASSAAAAAAAMRGGQGNVSRASVVVPRSFRLLDELERGEKGLGNPSVSLGTDDGDDLLMYSWRGTILGPHNSVHEGRIYQLKLYCDDDYPSKPPSVRFQSRINMTCVDQETGLIDSKSFPLLANWTPDLTMEDVLTELRKEMVASHNKKLPQPSEDDNIIF